MRRSRLKKFALPVLVLVALAAIGAASTNALSTTPVNNLDTAYGSVTVNGGASPGVTLSDLQYTTDASGQTISAVTLTFAGMTQSGTPAASDVVTLTASGLASPDTPLVPVNCTAGTYSATAMTYTCDDGGDMSWAVGDLTGMDVSVLPAGSTVG